MLCCSAFGPLNRVLPFCLACRPSLAQALNAETGALAVVTPSLQGRLHDPRTSWLGHCRPCHNRDPEPRQQRQRGICAAFLATSQSLRRSPVDPSRGEGRCAAGRDDRAEAGSFRLRDCGRKEVLPPLVNPAGLPGNVAPSLDWPGGESCRAFFCCEASHHFEFAHKLL